MRLDSQLQSVPDNAYRWQFNETILSAGIVFLLGMAMNATTLWGVQSNILELVEVNQDLRKLAAHSSVLALHAVNPAGSQNMRLPLPHELPNEDTAAIEASLMQPAPIGTTGPNGREIPPSTSGSVARKREPGERPAYGEWGPPLLLNAAQTTITTGKPVEFPQREEIQSNLMALGFNVREDHEHGHVGTRTLQALNEFRLLYLQALDRQKEPDSDQLTASIRKYAKQARLDQKKYNIDSGILAAIRLGSMRTGVDFSFLMELAAAESSFDPTRIAPRTAATGLYQFKEDTWLEAVKTYGRKYGIGIYASQVENYIDDAGNTQLRIRDPVIQQHALALRHNPRIAALLAAEYVKYNGTQLSNTLDREPGHAELYLTHFFGTTGAISFLKALDENPDRIAGEVFPKAARNNEGIFRPKLGKPRTVAEIYKLFDLRFNNSRYRDANPS